MVIQTHGSNHVAEMTSPVSHEPVVSTDFILNKTHLQKTKYGFKQNRFSDRTFSLAESDFSETMTSEMSKVAFRGDRR